jgi:hypothetical protein
MVASRWTTHPVVTIDCPVCDRPLPRVVVDVDARADAEVVEGRRRGRVLLLTVQAQTLDQAWWDAARAEHPDCIPDGSGPTTWCDACEVRHRCTHCHDDPPRGHTCPRCGTTRGGRA